MPFDAKSRWILVFLLGAWLAFGWVRAETLSERACQAIGGQDFSGLVDAPSQVTGTKLVAASKGVPSHCLVQGYVTPNVGVELRLPAANVESGTSSAWNGKFIEIGCGGFCGVVLGEACEYPLRRGYACLGSDQGHKSTMVDAKWAYNNLSAEVDYAYRAAHVAALAGKEITSRYYGKAPIRSYFMGCSGGGRQGMVEAQAFPWDFDGIIVGAPGMNITGVLMNLAWTANTIQGTSDKPRFNAADLQLLNRAALAQCDLDDGLKDGIIGNPLACDFSPAQLACKIGQKSPCLTEVQVTAAQKVYAGTTTARGEKVFVGGPMPGSELNWSGFIAGNPGINWRGLTADFFRYMAFIPDPGPSWKLSDFDFDRDYQRFGLMQSLYSDSNPDLRKFKSAGGKLLVYQGWNDEGAVPRNVVDYYETVEHTMGGRASTQDFFRLFMVPGTNHCSGGVGAFAIDYLSYLESWVEQGKAPEVLVGAHVDLPQYDYLNFPLDPKSVIFSRPVYPYPVTAKYKKGAHDPSSAASFQPVP